LVARWCLPATSNNFRDWEWDGSALVSVRVVPVMESGESGAAKGETGNRSKAGGFAGLQHSQGLGWGS